MSQGVEVWRRRKERVMVFRGKGMEVRGVRGTGKKMMIRRSAGRIWKKREELRWYEARRRTGSGEEEVERQRWRKMQKRRNACGAGTSSSEGMVIGTKKRARSAMRGKSTGVAANVRRSVSIARARAAPVCRSTRESRGAAGRVARGNGGGGRRKDRGGGNTHRPSGGTTRGESNAGSAYAVKRSSSDNTRVNDKDNDVDDDRISTGAERIWSTMRFFDLSSTSHMQPRFRGVATNDEGHIGSDRDDHRQRDHETALQLHPQRELGLQLQRQQHAAHAAAAAMIDDVTNFLTQSAAGAAVFLALISVAGLTRVDASELATPTGSLDKTMGELFGLPNVTAFGAEGTDLVMNTSVTAVPARLDRTARTNTNSSRAARREWKESTERVRQQLIQRQECVGANDAKTRSSAAAATAGRAMNAIRSSVAATTGMLSRLMSLAYAAAASVAAPLMRGPIQVIASVLSFVAGNMIATQRWTTRLEKERKLAATQLEDVAAENSMRTTEVLVESADALEVERMRVAKISRELDDAKLQAFKANDQLVAESKKRAEKEHELATLKVAYQKSLESQETLTRMVSDSECQSQLLRSGLASARQQHEVRSRENNKFMSEQQLEAKTVISECIALRKSLLEVESEKKKAEGAAEEATVRISTLESETFRLEMELNSVLKSEKELRAMLNDAQDTMQIACENMNEISGNARELNNRVIEAEEKNAATTRELENLRMKHDATESRLTTMKDEIQRKEREAVDARTEAHDAAVKAKEEAKRKLELQEKLHQLLKTKTEKKEISDLHARLAMAEKAAARFEKKVERCMPIINEIEEQWAAFEASSKASEKTFEEKMHSLHEQQTDAEELKWDIAPYTVPQPTPVAQTDDSGGDGGPKMKLLIERANEVASSTANKLQKAREVARFLRSSSRRDSEATRLEVKRHLPQMEVAMVTAAGEIRDIVHELKTQIEAAKANNPHSTNDLATQVKNSLSLIEQDFGAPLELMRSLEGLVMSERAHERSTPS